MLPAGQNRSAFDYASVPAEHISGAQECAAWVRSTMGKLEADTIETMAVVGARLIEAKDAIGHGAFMKWVKAECGLSHSTALRAMGLAENFGIDQIRHVTNLPRALVYEVVAPSTPAAVKEEIRAKISAGEPIDRKELESRIASAKSDAALFKARTRGKPATAANIAAYKERSEAAQRRGELADIEENDQRALARADALADARVITDLLVSRLTPDEYETARSRLSRNASMKIEMLAQAIREAFFPGAREEWDAAEARWASERQAKRAALDISPTRRAAS